jgi:hypothetical protein
LSVVAALVRIVGHGAERENVRRDAAMQHDAGTARELLTEVLPTLPARLSDYVAGLVRW